MRLHKRLLLLMTFAFTNAKAFVIAIPAIIYIATTVVGTVLIAAPIIVKKINSDDDAITKGSTSIQRHSINQTLNSPTTEQLPKLIHTGQNEYPYGNLLPAQCAQDLNAKTTAHRGDAWMGSYVHKLDKLIVRAKGSSYASPVKPTPDDKAYWERMANMPLRFVGGPVEGAFIYEIADGGGARTVSEIADIIARIIYNDAHAKCILKDIDPNYIEDALAPPNKGTPIIEASRLPYDAFSLQWDMRMYSTSVTNKEFTGWDLARSYYEENPNAFPFGGAGANFIAAWSNLDQHRIRRSLNPLIVAVIDQGFSNIPGFIDIDDQMDIEHFDTNATRIAYSPSTNERTHHGLAVSSTIFSRMGRNQTVGALGNGIFNDIKPTFKFRAINLSIVTTVSTSLGIRAAIGNQIQNPYDFGVENPRIFQFSKPATVINMSIGSVAPCAIVVQEAVDAALQRGTIIVAGAGNDQIAPRHYSGELPPLISNASCKGVLAVSAHDALDQVVKDYFPGVEYKTVSAPHMAPVIMPDSIPPIPDESARNYMEGTSFATPRVTAAIAMMKSIYPELTQKEAIEIILGTGIPTNQFVRTIGRGQKQPVWTGFDKRERVYSALDKKERIWPALNANEALLETIKRSERFSYITSQQKTQSSRLLQQEGSRPGDYEAGPIWNTLDAQKKCPSVCTAAKLKWSNQWRTTVAGQQSVCGCAP